MNFSIKFSCLYEKKRCFCCTTRYCVHRILTSFPQLVNSFIPKQPVGDLKSCQLAIQKLRQETGQKRIGTEVDQGRNSFREALIYSWTK